MKESQKINFCTNFESLFHFVIIGHVIVIDSDTSPAAESPKVRIYFPQQTRALKLDQNPARFLLLLNKGHLSGSK